MRRVRVSDVLRLNRRPVAIEPTTEYVAVGIRSFGKGIFHYPPTEGSGLSKLRFFEIHPNELVLSNIKAWEGAIAVSSRDDAGCIGSNRFLSYTPIDDAIDVRYACYFFLSEAGLPLIQRASPGSADRNRTLAIARFERIEIPLPSFEEQRRFVTRLDETIGKARQIAKKASAARSLDLALTEAVIQSVLDGEVCPARPLGEVAEINPRPQRVNGRVAFVPMSAVDDKLGIIRTPELADIEEIGGGYKQFRNGDVIFARITPCMQNGKSAVVALDGAEVGVGSTEFHVIRPGPEVLAPWVHAIVRTRRFRDAAAERFTGTAGQQRVPADFLRSVPIPVPSLDAQRRLLRRVERIEALANDLRQARSSALRRAKALEASALNDAFRAIAASP